MYKSLIRPLLFLFSAEKAHHITFRLLKITLAIPGMRFFFDLCFRFEHPSLEKEVFGLKFKNQVGLAAGFDKDAKMIDEFAALGFGFVEIGTLTPKAQPGNDKPRLFRLTDDEAIINRMGFNNEGAEAATARLRKVKSQVIIGGNIGKNKITPNDQAVSDYLQCFDTLFPYVHYFVVNVSSPNTPNLRELQEKEPLMNLLGAIQKQNSLRPVPKPVLLKIAPDLTDSQLDDIIEIVRETRLAGVIATNTTISRASLSVHEGTISAIGAGGLSGKPLSKRSTEVIRYLCERSHNAFPVIGVGGIHDPGDALEKLKAGASLVQLYTGLIYEGPSLVKRIKKAIVKETSAGGFENS